MKHVYMRKTHVFWSSPACSPPPAYHSHPSNRLPSHIVLNLSMMTMSGWCLCRGCFVHENILDKKNVRMDYRVVFSPSLSWSHTEAEEVRLLSTRKRERWYILRCLLTVLPSLSRSLCVCVSVCVCTLACTAGTPIIMFNEPKKIEPEITKR